MILVIAVFSVNIFTLNVPFFGDNITIFHELKITDSVVDDLVRNYSPARTRELDPGDTFIFRPVVFSIVTLQGHLFGYSLFELHQLTNVFFGALCALAMYAVLSLIVQRKEAFCGALLFAVQHTTSVSMRCQHTSAFVLAAACNMLTMYLFLRLENEKKLQLSKIFLIILLQSVAVFTQEIYAIPLFFYFVALVYTKSTKDGASATFTSLTRFSLRYALILLPALLFLVCDYLDYESHKTYISSLHAHIQGMGDVETAPLTWKVIPLTLYNFIYLNTKWFFDGFFGDVPRYVNLVLLVLLIVLVTMKRFRSGIPGNLFKTCFRSNLFKVSFFSVFTITFLYVFFRLNVRGLQYDAHLGLYRHLAWSFFAVALAVIFKAFKDFYSDTAQRLARFQKITTICFAVSLALNIGFYLITSYHRQENLAPTVKYIRQTRQLPQILQGEKVFVSGFDFLFPGNYSMHPDYFVRLGSDNSVEVIPTNQVKVSSSSQSETLSAIIPRDMYTVQNMLIDNITASHKEMYFNQHLIYPAQKSVLGYDIQFRAPVFLTELRYLFDKTYPPREFLIMATAPGSTEEFQLDSFFLCTRTHETPFWVRRFIPTPRLVQSVRIYLTDSSDYFDTKKPMVRLIDFTLYSSAAQNATVGTTEQRQP